MYRVRVAGHICLDLLPRLNTGIPSPGSLVEAGPLDMRLGGCVANTGLALGALGAPVDLVAAVGDDLLGDAVASLLAAGHSLGSSVASALRRVSGRSTSYSIVIDTPGEDRRFLHHVGANEVFDEAGVSVTGIDLLHVGYPQLLPAFVRDGGAGLTALLTRARAAGVTTSVDFATADPACTHDWPAMVRRWAPDIDVLTPSIDDLRPAFPSTGGDPVQVAGALAAELVRAGVGIALVTAGPAGMCLHTADPGRLRTGGRLLGALPGEWANRQLWAPAATVNPVRTTGAGDTATAGLLYGLLNGFGPEQALGLAADAAALHVSGIQPLPCGVDIVERRTSPADHTTYASGIFHGPHDGKDNT